MHSFASAKLSRADERKARAYYDRDADIAWLPTGDSDDVVSEKVEWGLIDHDATTDEVVGIEIWSASRRLPAELLATLPAPASTHGAAA